MREWMRTRHRGLFIRSYTVLAGGLLAVAILLDLGFDALQTRQGRPTDPWLVSTLRLMESELAAVPVDERAVRAAELAKTLKLEVDLLDAADISGAGADESALRELEDENGRIYFLWNSPPLDGAIRMGPFEPLRESPLVRFLPLLFYASILLIVGLWL